MRCYIQYMEAVGLMVSKKSVEANECLVWQIYIGRICEGDH